MIVFKNYLKVAKSFIGIIIIYTGIFFGISFIQQQQLNTSTSLDISSVEVAIIDNDKSEFTTDFTSYVKQEGNYVDLEDETDLKDALFYRKVSFIMIIPENYTNDVLQGKDVYIKTMQVPDSYVASYVKEIFNKYLNTATTYSKLEIKDVKNKIQEDLDNKANQVVVTQQANKDVQNLKYVFNFSNYTLLTIIIMVITVIIAAFNKEMVKKRIDSSPLKQKTFNNQILLGNLLVAGMIWLLYVGLAIIISKDGMFTINGILYSVNSLIFTMFAVTFSILLSKLTSEPEVISGVSNVVGLGFSFISGSFVPQAMLASSVVTISKITPSYWFVNTNEKIAELTKFDFQSLQPIFINMLIIIGFSLVLMIITQIYTKIKLKK